MLKKYFNLIVLPHTLLHNFRSTKIRLAHNQINLGSESSQIDRFFTSSVTTTYHSNHFKPLRLLLLLHQIQGITIHQVRRTLTGGIPCGQLIRGTPGSQRILHTGDKLIRIHRSLQLHPHLFIRVHHDKSRIS